MTKVEVFFYFWLNILVFALLGVKEMVEFKKLYFLSVSLLSFMYCRVSIRLMWFIFTVSKEYNYDLCFESCTYPFIFFPLSSTTSCYALDCDLLVSNNLIYELLPYFDSTLSSLCPNIYLFDNSSLNFNN